MSNGAGTLASYVLGTIRLNGRAPENSSVVACALCALKSEEARMRDRLTHVLRKPVSLT